MSNASPSRPRGPGYIVAVTAVVVLTAATLRAPFLAVAPVARDIGADLAVSAGVIGLLTSIPVLCFAVFSPVAILVVRRGGVDFALTVTLVGAVAGCLIRPLGGIEFALVGTAIMGLFLTIGNVVVPILVGREYDPRRVHTMTGVYTSSLNVGTMAVTLGTAPLSDVVGWRTGITVSAGFAVAALAVWLPLRGMRAAFTPQPGPPPPQDVRRISALRHPPTLLLAAAFSGQAFAFYGMTAWLPTLLSDQGFGQTAAGAIAAVFQVAGIAGSMLLPIVTVRGSALVGVICVGIGWLVLPLGFLLAPSLWLLWCLIGGIAQGGGVTVVFIMINALGGDEHTIAGRSGFVQGLGYGVASVGPITLGVVHESTGSWTLPLVIVVVAVLVFLTAGSMTAGSLRRRQGLPSSGQPV